MGANKSMPFNLSNTILGAAPCEVSKFKVGDKVYARFKYSKGITLFPPWRLGIIANPSSRLHAIGRVYRIELNDGSFLWVDKEDILPFDLSEFEKVMYGIK